MHLLLHHHHHHTYAARMGEAAPRASSWTGPDMEAAQQLVHLSSDEEEYCCGGANGGRRVEAHDKAAEGPSTQLLADEGKATSAAAREGEAAHGEDADDDEGGRLEEDGKGRRRISCSIRKRRFRSIAYLYRVTRPVRTHDVDANKRRKNIHI